MPELPEVETIVRQARAVLVGRHIAGVSVRDPRVISGSSDEFVTNILGAEIVDVTRRAKAAIFALSNGYALVVRLGMSGALLYERYERSHEGSEERHLHVLIRLEGASMLAFHDARRFGRLKVVNRDQLAGEFGRAGVDPFSPQLTPGMLRDMLSRHARRAIKPLMLDQSVIAGIGNIYADEVLFCARIHPARHAGTLALAETGRLLDCAREVLGSAIEHGGTTIISFVDLFGARGKHAEHLQVYGRTGKPCPGCGGSVERIKLNGRATHFCARCQR